MFRRSLKNVVAGGNGTHRATLPEGVPVVVEITPDEPGSYAFGCEMDMYRGTLVVR